MKLCVIQLATKPAARPGGLLELALTRENLQAAFKRVKANKGAAGVDGLNIEQTARMLQPLIDPTFSDHSHGFRPCRRAHDAVKAARACVQSGKRVVVDVDLAKFFDRVNHDILINEAKSAVCSAFGRKFLGYALWVAKGREVKCAVADKALGNFKARIRQLTSRSGGCSLAQVVDRLRPYLLGWKAYFGMARTPRLWRGLDEWLRHRWRNSEMLLNTVLTIAYFDRLGLPRLS